MTLEVNESGIARINCFDPQRWVAGQGDRLRKPELNVIVHIRLDSVLHVLRDTANPEVFEVHLELGHSPVLVRSINAKENAELEKKFIAAWHKHRRVDVV